MTSNTPIERSLDREERSELDHLIEEGAQQITEDRRSSPQIIIRRIREFIDEQRESTLDDDVREDLSYCLGALWGEQLCRELGWDWVALKYTDTSNEYTAVVSPDRSFVYFPMNWVYELITEPDKENTLGLVFNMLRAKRDLPNPTPGSYQIPYR